MPQRIIPRKTTYMSCRSSSRGRGRGRAFEERASEPLYMISPTRPAPPPPVGPLRRPQQGRDKNHRSVGDEDGKDESALDPASKIWAKIRRASGLSVSRHQRIPSMATTASVTASVNLPFSAACGTTSRALRRKKAGLGEGDRPTQRQRLADMDSQQSLVDRTNLNAPDDGVNRRSPKDSSKSRRASGKWGFSNWWLNS